MDDATGLAELTLGLSADDADSAGQASGVRGVCRGSPLEMR
jgi:hypothetical protein